MDISSRRIFQGDTVIWVVFFLLCMISLIEVFSAASTLTYKSGDFMAPFFKQLLFLGLGTGVAWFFHAIPCRYFKIIPLFFPCASSCCLSRSFSVRPKTAARAGSTSAYASSHPNWPRESSSFQWPSSSPTCSARKAPTGGLSSSFSP